MSNNKAIWTAIRFSIEVPTGGKVKIINSLTWKILNILLYMYTYDFNFYLTEDTDRVH